MARALLIPVLGLALLGAACGRGGDVLVVEFPDELVEAPARTVSVAVVVDNGCQNLLALPHDGLEETSTVLARADTRYPVDPSLDVFENMPRGRPLAVDVVVRGEQGLVIARSCVAATLEPDQQTTITLQMHGLPPCEAPPTSLDLVIVLDTSTGMRDANIGLDNELIPQLKGFVENLGVPGGDVRFSVVTHGHTEPTTLIPPTTDRQAILQGLDSLQGVANGDARHYAGLRVAVEGLRDRALCGWRPAVLWLGGGPDESDSATYQIATIGVVGTRGESFDDIYVHAIGVSEASVTAMRLLIEATEGPMIEGALTSTRLAGALVNARTNMQSLIPLPE